MSVPDNFPKRIAWHEAAHAFVSAYHGFHLLAVRIDGPENGEGATWKNVPPKASSVFLASLNQRELANSLAGEVAESMWFPALPSLRPDLERDGIASLRFVLKLKGTPRDFSLADRIDVSDWIEKLPCGRLLRDTLAAEKAAVRKILERNRSTVEIIANRLLEKQRIWGDEVSEILEQVKGTTKENPSGNNSTEVPND